MKKYKIQFTESESYNIKVTLQSTQRNITKNSTVKNLWVFSSRLWFDQPPYRGKSSCVAMELQKI